MKVKELIEKVNYYRYWGKASRDKEEMKYHLLVYHSLDVAAVGRNT